MRERSGEDTGALLVHAQGALGMLQVRLGTFLGVSSRTMRRWTVGGALLTFAQLTKLTQAIYPKNPDLAARIAAAYGYSLAEVGIVPPAPPPVVEPASSLEKRLLADALVCAAAEVADVSPRAMRPALVAALSLAREAGLSLDDACALLAPPASKSKKT